MALGGHDNNEQWPARWAERFGQLFPYLPPPREDDLAWKVALHAAGSAAFAIYPFVERVLRRCESPPERALVAAVLMEVSYNDALWVWLGSNREGRSLSRPQRFLMFPECRPSTGARRIHPSNAWFGEWAREHGARVIVYPQLRVGPYRADLFAVSERHRNGVVTSRRTMVIECDGHEFHEKTKEQASSDKARDRYMQARGHLVFRFSGSDIWHDPLKCAREVHDVLRGGTR